MSDDRVVSPEVGRVYLIRRFINGSRVSRYQPALITARLHRTWVQGAPYDGFYLNVTWLFDGAKQVELYEAYAETKALSPRWLRTEHARAKEDLALATKRFDAMEVLRLRGELGFDGSEPT